MSKVQKGLMTQGQGKNETRAIFDHLSAENMHEIFRKFVGTTHFFVILKNISFYTLFMFNEHIDIKNGRQKIKFHVWMVL